MRSGTPGGSAVSGRAVKRMAPLLIAAGVLVAACSGGDDGASADATVTIVAAASLTESFTEIGRAFESGNPGIDVDISFGPSSALVRQVIEGAAVDIVATASTTTMDTAIAAGVVESARIFATNALAIAVPVRNAAGISDISDLARPGVLVAVCEPRVPCGEAAQQVIAASGLALEPVTYEVDVKAVLGKVILDEVDAGMVYRTDIVAAGESVRGIEVPADTDASVSYPIARAAEALQPAAAQRFIDFVLSPQGQSILQRHGFGPAS